MSEETTAIPTCREVVEHLGEWCEGQLEPGEEKPFALHLQLCPPCADIANGYQALARVARAALAVEMPEDAKERLRRRIAARLQDNR
jgi:anti-sigma factor ChrR (cupin superfamily)